MAESKKFTAMRRQPLRLSPDTLVETGTLDPSMDYPLVVRPRVDRLDLSVWGSAKRAFVEGLLLRHGALLFRGFAVASLSAFREFAAAVSTTLIEYGERSSPRTRLEPGVYTSTDHPADQRIVLHHEQSYTLSWPMKIFFFCVEPARVQGRTPIADGRRALARLDPAIVERFERDQIMYVRNYGDGLGLSWQEAFGTTHREGVEDHCRRTGIQVEWKSEGRLRTRQIRPALRRHPVTGERLWFNHAVFFHVSSLDPAARASMLAVVDEAEVPFNTFYGDGSPIEPSVLDAIRAAYDAGTVSFAWEAGDVLLLDNMVSAHGREPFVGSRRIAVAMADPSGAPRDAEEEER